MNWDGFNRVSDQNYRIRDALDCYCTGGNWCYIAAHSAGNLQIGCLVDVRWQHPHQEERHAQRIGPMATWMAPPRPDGTSSGSMWPAGAGGGSELANVGSWPCPTAHIRPEDRHGACAVRPQPDPCQVVLHVRAGAKGTLYSAILPGQDDEAVAYHSLRRCFRAAVAHRSAIRPIGSATTLPWALRPTKVAVRSGTTTPWPGATIARPTTITPMEPGAGSFPKGSRRHGGQRQLIRVIR